MGRELLWEEKDFTECTSAAFPTGPPTVVSSGHALTACPAPKSRHLCSFVTTYFRAPPLVCWDYTAVTCTRTPAFHRSC